MTDHRTTVGKKDDDLDRQLDTALDAFNEAATADQPPQEKLTVKIEEGDNLVGGVSGWTWGAASGISMTWVQKEYRGTGLGAQLMSTFEREARRRGCTHVFVTSFTFQAPGSYQGLGYEEFARWDSIPTPGSDDVHMRKQL